MIMKISYLMRIMIGMKIRRPALELLFITGIINRDFQMKTAAKHIICEFGRKKIKRNRGKEVSNFRNRKIIVKAFSNG